MKRFTPEEIIRFLHLEPHPAEGGFFRETYRSETKVPATELPDAYQGTRSAGTAIYYLVTSDSFSVMHRVRGDEMFHFYLGDPVDMLQLEPHGSGRVVTLGNDLKRDQRLQVLVKGGVWQGLRLQQGGRFALLGTTMSPGFEYEDFELGSRDELVNNYSEFEELIRALTPTDLQK